MLRIMCLKVLVYLTQIKIKIQIHSKFNYYHKSLLEFFPATGELVTTKLYYFFLNFYQYS